MDGEHAKFGNRTGGQRSENETMTKRAKRPEAHIFMSQEDRDDLQAWAEQECRSVNGQVLHILRSALAVRRSSIVGLTPQTQADRIRDASRRIAKEARG